jgi:hypothetical protein
LTFILVCIMSSCGQTNNKIQLDNQVKPESTDLTDFDPYFVEPRQSILSADQEALHEI